MAQLIQKNSKRKYGLTSGYMAKLLSEATEEACIPMIQRNGSVKYVSEFDFQWMIDNGFIDGVKSFDSQANPEPSQ